MTSNVTPSALADEIGKLDAEAKALAAVLDAKKDQLKDMLRASHETVARGESYIATVSESTSERIDTKKLRAALGDALDGYTIRSTSVRLTLKPVLGTYEVA